MKLTALRLHNVRRFAGRGVAVEGIGDGVNVLCAVNEFGKSTCFDALHALFFQPHTGTPPEACESVGSAMGCVGACDITVSWVSSPATSRG